MVSQRNSLPNNSFHTRRKSSASALSPVSQSQLNQIPNDTSQSFRRQGSSDTSHSRADSDGFDVVSEGESLADNYQSTERTDEDMGSNEVVLQIRESKSNSDTATIDKRQLRELVEEAFYQISTEGLSMIREDEPSRNLDPPRPRDHNMPMESLGGGVAVVNWKELS